MYNIPVHGNQSRGIGSGDRAGAAGQGAGESALLAQGIKKYFVQVDIYRVYAGAYYQPWSRIGL